MSLVGYARVSTHSQNEDSQVDDLKAAGCDRIFTDHGASGKHASRPEWDKCMAYLRPGDTLVITRFSRAMRSLHQLMDVVNGTAAADRADGFKARGIGLKVLHQDIDTTTVTGRLMFNILGAIDEWQRELIVEGTEEGLRAARARGRNGGRPRRLSAEQERLARRLYDDGTTVADIAALLGSKDKPVARGTVYAALDRTKVSATAEAS
jgi:DNA invertase Pin-like site-specific DNA recombinase